MDTASIRAAMAKELNLQSSLIPEGHKGALVVVFDGSMLRTALATKFHGNWQISGTLGYHTPPGKNAIVGEVQVKTTW